MALANQEAIRLHHDYLAPVHILLGILSVGSSVAALVLKNLAVDLETLRDFIVAARETADRKGIPLFVDVDDFQPTESEGPLCSEPWETLYLLNRGIMPCCFGKKPLATLDGVPPGELGSFVAETFNGPAYRELRKGLAAGELPRYCRETKSCPIVKKVMGA